MTVEYLNNGKWVAMPNATAKHIEGNHHWVTIAGVPRWLRVTAIDNAPVSVGAALHVWGAPKSGHTRARRARASGESAPRKGLKGGGDES